MSVGVNEWIFNGASIFGVKTQAFITTESNLYVKVYRNVNAMGHKIKVPILPRKRKKMQIKHTHTIGNPIIDYQRAFTFVC